MGIFIAYPWLAIVFAGSFAALWGWRRKPAAAFSCIAWAAYGVYEYLMLTRVLCTGECNIRVDLLLIYPLLLAVSFVAIFQSLKNGGATNGRAA